MGTLPKRCTHCKLLKPASAFHRKKASQDGLTPHCKDCKREKDKERYRADPDYRAKLNQAWLKRNQKQKAKGKRKFPAKAKARKAIQNAVARGTIIKPTACEGCDTPTPKHKLHGHHHDYDKPLEVEWLCSGCHSTKE